YSDGGRDVGGPTQGTMNIDPLFGYDILAMIDPNDIPPGDPNLPPLAPLSSGSGGNFAAGKPSIADLKSALERLAKDANNNNIPDCFEGFPAELRYDGFKDWANEPNFPTYTAESATELRFDNLRFVLKDETSRDGAGGLTHAPKGDASNPVTIELKAGAVAAEWKLIEVVFHELFHAATFSDPNAGYWETPTSQHQDRRLVEIRPCHEVFGYLADIQMLRKMLEGAKGDLRKEIKKRLRVKVAKLDYYLGKQQPQRDRKIKDGGQWSDTCLTELERRLGTNAKKTPKYKEAKHLASILKKLRNQIIEVKLDADKRFKRNGITERARDYLSDLCARIQQVDYQYSSKGKREKDRERLKKNCRRAVDWKADRTLPPLCDDPDGDGLSDKREKELGTNRNVADSDGDGKTDGEEAGFFGTGTDPTKADTDNDDVNDGEEIDRGSDPLDPSSKPESLRHDAGGCSDSQDNDGDGDTDASDLGCQQPNDDDEDGVDDAGDNCPGYFNPDQFDNDFDTQGDACDSDDDNDGTPDDYEVMLGSDAFNPASQPEAHSAANDYPNAAQVAISCTDGQDNDQDGLIDNQERSCELLQDSDGDQIPDRVDVCPDVYDPGQANELYDEVGDACDPDLDGDGIEYGSDSCPLEREDFDDVNDTDGCADNDDDADGTDDYDDNCDGTSNPSQADTDLDGVGDACDTCPNDPGPLSQDGCATFGLTLTSPVVDSVLALTVNGPTETCVVEMFVLSDDTGIELAEALGAEVRTSSCLQDQDIDAGELGDQVLMGGGGIGSGDVSVSLTPATAGIPLPVFWILVSSALLGGAIIVMRRSRLRPPPDLPERP
ncbi:MAG: hypothetical protein GY725_17595, partial [bacterium]|nr:hypothetical protein [bacterium]